MYRRFVNARSPLRLLEKGLHGGLGPGNLGLVLAGPGVGKTSFLVCVALDELLRSGRVLHAAEGQTVAHVRAFYDTVFEDLAATTHLEDEVRTRREIEQHRSIRTYVAGGLGSAKLREAARLEKEAEGEPTLVIVDGLDLAAAPRAELADLRALAGELSAEIWLSHAVPDERRVQLPEALERIEDLVSVVLALEPGPEHVALRAVKDHDNPDVTALHVALDPRTLLLTRS